LKAIKTEFIRGHSDWNLNAAEAASLILNSFSGTRRFSVCRMDDLMKTADWAPPKTVHRLHQALLDLMEQKDYDQIAIKDITDTAGINRRTFYLHYENKEQLLNEIYLNFVEWTLRPFRDPLAINPNTGRSDFFLKSERFIAAVKENRKLAEILFRDDRRNLAFTALLSIFLSERAFSSMDGSFFLYHFDDPEMQYYYSEMVCQNCISSVSFILNNIDLPNEIQAKKLGQVIKVMGILYNNNGFE